MRLPRQRFHPDQGAANLAVMRHIARNLRRSEKTARVGIQAKRLKAVGEDAYLRKALAASCNRPTLYF